MRARFPALIAALLLVLVASCSDDGPSTDAASTTASPDSTAPDAPAGAFTLESLHFADGDPIPSPHICTAFGGENLPIELRWSNVPEGTTSLALVMDDPDASTPEPFVHWVVVDLDPASGGTDGTDGTAGLPTIGDAGYFGPCAPPGDPHTYHLRLYALVNTPEWSAEPTAAEVAAEAEGALGVAELTGTFDSDG